MSVGIQRYRARCEGCRRGFADSSETFIEEAADAHEDRCDELGPDEEVVIEEVEPDD